MEIDKKRNYGKIVASAVELFNKKGFDNVSVSEICKDVNIQRCSFYSVFSSKEEILFSIFSNLTKSDFNISVNELLAQKSDLERIWFIYSKYLDLATKLGPDLMTQIIKISISRKFNCMDLINEYDEWFAPLIVACQKQKIIRNETSPEILIAMSKALCTALIYDWCTEEGNYSLHEKAIAEIEILYDLPLENRKHNFN